MSSYGNTPPAPGRQRRGERYAGEFLVEPSMSAPQPIPGTKARTVTPAPVPEVESTSVPPQQPWQPTAATAPVTPPGAQAGWSQAYTAPMGSQPYAAAQQPGVQPDWSQPYAATQQPGTQPDWSQPYAAAQQPGVQPDWSQPYTAAQQPCQAQHGWSQPYAVPPGATYGAMPGTQPYAAQMGTQPYAAQNGTAPMQPAAPSAGWPGNGYTPPVQPPVQEGGGQGGGSNWWKLALLAVLVVAVVTGAVVGGVRLGKSNALHTEVSRYNDRFCEGVYVDGIHLGGMTQQEAINAVEAHAQERLSAWSVNLTYGGQLIRQITAADLGMTVNVHDALAEAWQQGHETSDVTARKEAMDALAAEPYHGYTAMPSGDTTAIDRILSDLAAPVYRAPQDATVTFISDAHAYPFEYTPEVYGSYLDVEPIKRQIYAMVDTMESGSIELTPQPIPPRVTEADLRRTRTLRGSAKTEISSVSTPDRTANIQRAFQLINGTVVKPGATFSFNTVVGARSEANGFFKAIEYAYGNERMGYGGGVCQASTTLYLAAIRADMTITHREPHSDKVNYTEYGLDATVNYDGKKIDLTFKNTTASDVYVMAYLVRANNHWVCQVDIYGEALPEGVTFDLVAETVEVLPAPVDPEYVKDTSGTNVIYVDDEPVQKRPASDGYVVETFRVKYLNGKEVERTYVARDTYKAKARQLWVGVQEREDFWGP